MGYVYGLLLGTFTKPLRKATAGHVVSVRLSARNGELSWNEFSWSVMFRSNLSTYHSDETPAKIIRHFTRRPS